jgi:hypothetical protein
LPTIGASSTSAVSTPNEGTYHFKAQWGAQPGPMHWEYWLASGAMPESEPCQPEVPGRHRRVAALAAVGHQSRRAAARPEHPMTGAPATARTRYDSLDAWRGVACLMVIVYHSTLMQRSHAATAGAGTLETLAQWSRSGHRARQRRSGPVLCHQRLLHRRGRRRREVRPPFRAEVLSCAVSGASTRRSGPSSACHVCSSPP